MGAETGGRVARAWRQYRMDVLPGAAPAIQVQETRRAFYAGAMLTLETLHDAVGPDTVSEDEGVEIMEAVHTELMVFLEAVKRGRA